MSPILLHIYGPFAIHSFGLMIVIGLILTLYLLNRDKKLQKLITSHQLSNIINICVISGIIGGRIWFLATNFSEITTWTDYFTVWNGGLSILGAIIGIVIGLSWYISSQKLPLFAILDRFALYAPLLQSISRFGCFLAGCCYGLPTHLPWGIIYTHAESLAPLHVMMHPTQIYSSSLLFLSFVVLYCFDIYKRTKPGQIISLYIMLTTAERFFVEFWRGDQIFYTECGYFRYLSIQQLLAVLLFVAALILFIFITIYKKTDESI